MTQTILLMLIYAHRFQVIKRSIKTSLLPAFFASQLHCRTSKCQRGEVVTMTCVETVRGEEEEEEDDALLTLTGLERADDMITH